MIILLFATVLDGRKPGAVGSGSQISYLGPHRRARLTLVSAAHTLPCKLRRAAKRQSRILLVRDIIQHPKGAFDFYETCLEVSVTATNLRARRSPRASPNQPQRAGKFQGNYAEKRPPRDHR